jgi:aminoglycoside phosphotransferase (APT) family kinase protein
MRGDTAKVRPGEELDEQRLAEYLRQPVEIEQFPGGHSNLTYLVRVPDREYVLRRAPLGPVPPKAHDMAREYRILAAVGPCFSPAPRVYALCEDPKVIGATFFLMERRRGVILRETVPPQFAAIPDHPARLSQAYLDCLIAFHAVDARQEPIASLGKPEGFVERQVRGWSERWKHARTADLPEMDRVIQWLGSNIRQSGDTTLVHNDYKLDNLMFDSADPARIEALLDWEMTTIGDPLADFGLALTYWCHAEVPGMRRSGQGVLSTQPGWMTRDELVRHYAQRTGRDLSALPYHEVLGVFKLAVILQQIYYRYVNGQTRDERFRDFDQAVAQLASRAACLMEHRD